MEYPIYINPTDEVVQIWEYDGCIFCVSVSGVQCLCTPDKSASNSVEPTPGDATPVA